MNEQREAKRRRVYTLRNASIASSQPSAAPRTIHPHASILRPALSFVPSLPDSIVSYDPDKPIDGLSYLVYGGPGSRLDAELDARNRAAEKWLENEIRGRGSKPAADATPTKANGTKTATKNGESERVGRKQQPEASVNTRAESEAPEAGGGGGGKSDTKELQKGEQEAEKQKREREEVEEEQSKDKEEELARENKEEKEEEQRQKKDEDDEHDDDHDSLGPFVSVVVTHANQEHLVKRKIYKNEFPVIYAPLASIEGTQFVWHEVYEQWMDGRFKPSTSLEDNSITSDRSLSSSKQDHTESSRLRIPAPKWCCSNKFNRLVAGIKLFQAIDTSKIGAPRLSMLIEDASLMFKIYAEEHLDYSREMWEFLQNTLTDLKNDVPVDATIRQWLRSVRRSVYRTAAKLLVPPCALNIHKNCENKTRGLPSLPTMKVSREHILAHQSQKKRKAADCFNASTAKSVERDCLEVRFLLISIVRNMYM